MIIRAAADEALLVRTLSRPVRVVFDSTFALPVVTHVERMALGPVTLCVTRERDTGLVCRDALRADVSVSFRLRVLRNEEAVARVAQEVGCERAMLPETLASLFTARFAEAMRDMATQTPLAELERDPDAFGHALVARIGADLRGYELVDASVTRFGRTPREHLDPHNIHDARALRRMDELDAEAEPERVP